MLVVNDIMEERSGYFCLKFGEKADFRKLEGNAILGKKTTYVFKYTIFCE